MGATAICHEAPNDRCSPHSLLPAPRRAACGVACARQDAGAAHTLRQHARRSCLSATTKKCSEFCGAPHRQAPQAARSESAGTQVAGSPFLGLLSFGEAKESKSAVGPRPDFLPHHKHTAPTGNNKAPIPAFPQRGKEFNTPSPLPSPASGRGSSGRSACATPHASCKTGVLRHKNSNFRRLFERRDAGAK